jgi:hypothetical protein
VVVQDNPLNIKPGWNSGKFPLILVLAVSGLILLVPLIVVAIISLSTMGEQREITTDITKIVNEPVSKAVNYSVDVTSQLEKLADLKEKGILTEAEFQEKKTKLLSEM